MSLGARPLSRLVFQLACRLGGFPPNAHLQSTLIGESLRHCPIKPALIGSHRRGWSQRHGLGPPFWLSNHSDRSRSSRSGCPGFPSPFPLPADSPGPALHSPGPTMSQKQEEENPAEETGEEKQVRARGRGRPRGRGPPPPTPIGRPASASAGVSHCCCRAACVAVRRFPLAEPPVALSIPSLIGRQASSQAVSAVL